MSSLHSENVRLHRHTIDRARAAFQPGEFYEIFVDTPLAVVEERDPKGLYARARRGEVKHMTGIDSPYEPPESPELRLETGVLPAGDAAREVVRVLEANGRLSATAEARAASR